MVKESEVEALHNEKGFAGCFLTSAKGRASWRNSKIWSLIKLHECGFKVQHFPRYHSSNQRWAQLSRVPLFEVLKFRWGSTSSTQKASVWLLNQNSGRRPFGLACPGMFINTDQSLSIFTGFQVEEVDPQRNFRTSKRGTLVNWAPLCPTCHRKLGWLVCQYVTCHSHSFAIERTALVAEHERARRNRWIHFCCVCVCTLAPRGASVLVVRGRVI